MKLMEEQSVYTYMINMATGQEWINHFKKKSSAYRKSQIKLINKLDSMILREFTGLTSIPSLIKMSERER